VLAWPEGSATIEDLEPGKNTVEVTVVDYAAMRASVEIQCLFHPTP
jgi:hypothetical protein